MDDKYVAVKVPKDLHIYLKEKAKEKDMTMGNYLFDCICRIHDIKVVPATVVLPETAPVEKPTIEKPVQEEIIVDKIEPGSETIVMVEKAPRDE